MALTSRKRSDQPSKVLRALRNARMRGDHPPQGLRGEEARREAQRANRRARSMKLKQWGLSEGGEQDG